jgi:hypothetical protein
LGRGSRGKVFVDGTGALLRPAWPGDMSLVETSRRRVSELEDQFWDGRKRGIMKMVMLEAPHGVVVTDWCQDSTP